MTRHTQGQARPGGNRQTAGTPTHGMADLKLHLKDMFTIIQRIPGPETPPCN